jgi:hypothetical protein
MVPCERVDLHLVAEDGDGSEIGFERQLVVTSPRSEIGNLLQIQVKWGRRKHNARLLGPIPRRQ